MSRKPSTYILSPALVAAHCGTQVRCLAVAGMGRSFRLYGSRPGPWLNRRVMRLGGGRFELAPRTDLPSGAAHVVKPVEAEPALVRVDIIGALEQRAGFYDEPGKCFGWSDGHDAIAERLIAAFREGDVLCCIDSPGGAAMGLPESVERVLRVKAQYNRRATVIAAGQICSAGYWWGSAIADDLFATVGSEIGCIGARAGHASIAGQLAKEGVEITEWADPPDKIALSPNRPLSPVGNARGGRDVKIAAEAFRGAVCASPIGERRKLTPEMLIELGADTLIGQAAVDAGIADDVTTEDDATAYALTLTQESARSVNDAATAMASAFDKARRLAARTRAKRFAPRRAA